MTSRPSSIARRPSSAAAASTELTLAPVASSAKITFVRVIIVGHHLPGRTCPQPHGAVLTNVHVAVQERSEAIGQVAGDAPAARWELDVDVVTGPEGGLDFRGPVVHGKRGERFIYLTWGDVGRNGSFEMFRRAKLMLNRIDAAIVHAAMQPDSSLVAAIDLTDERGGPRCARVDPPALTWSVGER
jgi:hypothetical protein